MVGYAVTINWGVDVTDIAVLILFTCWKLWGDGLSVSDVDDVRLVDTDEELVIYTVIDGEYVVCEEMVVLRLGVGVGVIVELPDTLGLMLPLEDALVLWDGPVDIDTLELKLCDTVSVRVELKLDDVEVDAVTDTLDVEDAVVDISVL